MKKIAAFTLVELSIVIVIIGLIVAGITAGKSLVRQAQLRSVITDIESFKSSINSFRLQYNYLPGDMPNAFSYWGASCAATSTLCNGNGDRFVGPGVGWQTEGLRAWQHLALAGLVKGMYTGTFASGTVQIGSDVPAADLPNGGYHFFYDNSVGAVSGNVIQIGALRTSDRPCTNLLSAPEASAIDSKADDGIPDAGKVYGSVNGYPSITGGSWGTSSCMSGTGASSTYVLTNTANNSCRLGFKY